MINICMEVQICSGDKKRLNQTRTMQSLLRVHYYRREGRQS